MVKINGKKMLANEPTEAGYNSTALSRTAISVLSNEEEVRTRYSEVVTKEIPIEFIKGREVNNYIVNNIESLAESIEKVGQWQEIVVRVDRDSDTESYICVAGHRRLEAFRYLRKKYLDKYHDENHKMVLLYSYIRARVMSAEEELNEETVYDDTNSHTRIPTVFEALLRFDLDSINMQNPDTMKDFIIKAYGPEKYDQYLNGSFKVKPTSRSLYLYLQKLIENYFPTMDASVATIKKYHSMITKACPELIESVLSGNIPLRDATVFATYPIDKQILLIKNYGTTNIKDLLNDKEFVPEVEHQEENVNDYKSNIHKLNKIITEINTLQNNLSAIPKKELNGNQKELIKEINKLNKMIEKINAMPRE